MNDSITNCLVYKDSNGAVLGYSITFSFDSVNVPISSSIVYIGVSSLVNSNDLAEVKKMACIQASAIKTLYSNTTTITDLNGPVTL
jgi:hypothetical protein